MRTVTAVLIVAALGAGVPAPALAKLRPIPPSNPAANQYVESLPTAGGAAPSAGLTLHSSSHWRGATPGAVSRPGAVPSRTGSAMVKAGNAGRQAAIFAQATAPTRRLTQRAGAANARAATSRSTKARSGAPAASSAASTSSVHPTSPSLAVVRSLTGVDGVAALPIVLILIALAITAVAVYRRRTT